METRKNNVMKLQCKQNNMQTQKHEKNNVNKVQCKQNNM